MTYTTPPFNTAVSFWVACMGMSEKSYAPSRVTSGGRCLVIIGTQGEAFSRASL